MRRLTLLLATVVLAVATAAVLTSAAWLLPVTSAEPTTAAEPVARRFYEAVNTAIATGDPAPLRAIVAENFVAGDALPGIATGRAGLEETLADMHATSPAIRLEIEALVASGDRVMARIGIGGWVGGSFLHIPIAELPRPWSTVDLLRVKGGKIVERQGVAENTGLLRPVQAAPLQFAGPVRRVVTLERVVLPPSTSYDGTASLAPHMLLVEGGAVRLQRAAASPVVILSAGEMAVVPNGSRFAATNTGDGDATLLHLAFALPQPGGPAMASGATPATGDATTHVLAGGSATLLPAGPLEVGIGRVLLGRGATFSLAATDGVALLTVNTSRMGVTGDGPIRVHRADGSGAVVESARIDAADGVLIEPGTSFDLRNDGAEPVDALLVTITATTA